MKTIFERLLLRQWLRLALVCVVLNLAAACELPGADEIPTPSEEVVPSTQTAPPPPCPPGVVIQDLCDG